MGNLPNKIKNLYYLKKVVSVPEFCEFKVKDFLNDSNKILNKIRKKYKKKIIIRSACFDEDSENSNAGKYLSIPNIDASNKFQLKKAINDVINSYTDKQNNYFFVQVMISNSKLSGVILTCDINYGYPIVNVNFTLSKKTDLITSGASKGNNFKFLLDERISKIKLTESQNQIIDFVKKILNCYEYKNLDIEFLIDIKNKIHLLQVRKLKNKNGKYISIFNDINFAVEKKLNKLFKESSLIIGKTNSFSTMADWNPAEIIGLKPHPLSLSLYETLITDDVWAKSRRNLGYKNIGDFPLMITILGTPYIDIRADFNSFIPKNISKTTSIKIVNYYLGKYRRFSSKYYDKIESELVLNCYDFSTSQKIKDYSFLNISEKSDLEFGLKNITIDVIKKLDNYIENYSGLFKLLNKISQKDGHPINKIFEIIHVTKQFGTLPFANLARCAFISISFLESMVEKNIISSNEKSAFLNSISSVTTEINNMLYNKKVSLFLNKFGHLRPNTYDIITPNYRENFHEYFSDKKYSFVKHRKFIFNKKQEKLIEFYLKKTNLNIKLEEFILFLKKSIYHREYSKLYFTKGIDLIFLELTKIFESLNINKNNICFVNIKDILNLYNNFNHYYVIDEIKKIIKINKKNYQLNKTFNLPSIINSSLDMIMSTEPNVLPTFISTKVVNAEKVYLRKNFNINFKNKIILIKNADPGYDFLFTKNIGGLITLYGGPNSHMAIRCNEMDIPAVIGIGTEKFQNLLKFKNICIDCRRNKIHGW